MLTLKRDLQGPDPVLRRARRASARPRSAARSRARSGRKFVRISLGGVRDEAEIRGHRRTYVGALPGRIIQGLRRAGTRNPVFMLDEIDKLGADFRGDPSSALLEVLDPEQNYDLQRPLPRGALRPVAGALHRHREPARPDPAGAARPHGGDRAARLHRGGEARDRASATCCRASSSENGLDEHATSRSPTTRCARVIRSYTREAGVRNLEREIATLCRKVARRVAEEGASGPSADRRGRARRRCSGPVQFEPEVAERAGSPGVASGLAWTPAGGDILFVEATRMPGKGELKLTGSLGDVMHESARGGALAGCAPTPARSALDPRAASRARDLHVHVPAGARAEGRAVGGRHDGDGAGLAAHGRAGAPDVAMTGEITLRGKVLPVGGIKEKVLAAQRAGIRAGGAAGAQPPRRRRRSRRSCSRGSISSTWGRSMRHCATRSLRRG